jgi:hypothetical protein
VPDLPQPPRFKLTIGELFPADDLVGQWVFTLTSLAEDVAMLMGHLDTEQPREKMLFYRLLLTRLYEARRLIWARARYREIEEFTSGGLTFAGVDLVAAYTRPPEGKSPVEQLYSDSRHRTVHYSHVGKPELRGLRRDYQNFPARMVVRERDRRLSVEYEWVAAVRAEEAWGAQPWTPGFVQHLETFGQQTSALATAWGMISNVLLMVYARRRGIPLERMVEDPEKLRRLVENQ